MEAETSQARVLLVSDWTVDPGTIVAAAASRNEREPASFAVLVPAWLHGLDWAGDPAASVPCAQRQLQAILALATATGLTVHDAAVGDPDPTTAIADALERVAADSILLCAPARRPIFGPLDLARRAHRLSGLPVERAAISAAAAPGVHWLSTRRKLHHCTAEAARAA
jgi:hypothetical protein